MDVEQIARGHYPSRCIPVFHNICGRRTTDKPCACQQCEAIRHHLETRND